MYLVSMSFLSVILSLEIGYHKFLEKLVGLYSIGLDVTVGMHWLGKHKSLIDCDLRPLL